MRSLGLAWRAACGLLAAALFAGCGSQRQPNLLIVTFDTTRFDRFGATGDTEARTPVVDALAARGVLFERAYASVPLTLPSHTTLLTGLHPIAHGVHDNGRFAVAPEVRTLAEILKGAGYDTAAFVSAMVLNRRYQLAQGFDVYGDSVEPGRSRGWMVPQRPGAEVVDEALGWLEQRKSGAPFFLWAHFYDPHEPRDPQAPFEEMPDAYRAEIAYADAQLGRLLEAVQSSRRETLIVFTADHGESLGEHGEATHGIVAYDSTLHVPLILAGPGVPAGVRSRAFARHVDVVPTVLAALRIPPGDALPGRDLLALAAAPAEAEDAAPTGYFESRGQHYALGWAEILGVRSGRWKYTAEPSPPELFDVEKDPREQRNLAEAEPAVVAQMAERWERLRQEQARPELSGQRRTLELAEAEQLAALGYIEAPGQFAPGEEPDPRRFAAVHSWVERARGLARSGAYGQAIELLAALEQSRSVRPLVLRTLAPVYLEAGRLDDAVEAYRQYVALGGSSEASAGLARTLLAAGRPQEALEALADTPVTAGIAELRAWSLWRLGRLGEARTSLDDAFPDRPAVRAQLRAQLELEAAPQPDGEAEVSKLLAAAPDDPVVKSRVGMYRALWAAQGQADALALLRDATAASPKDPELQANLGWSAFRLGEDAEAASALEAALALDPTRPKDQLRLAFVLHRRGEKERALELVRGALAASPGASWVRDARALESALEAEVPKAAPPGAQGGGPS